MKTSVKILIILLILTTVASVVYLYQDNTRDKMMAVDDSQNQNTMTYPNAPVGLKGVQQEIVWLKYENRELGITFRYPPNSSATENSYNGQNGAVFSVDVYDPSRYLGIFNTYLEGVACPFSGIVGNEEKIASSTFKHTTETYDEMVYERYTTDKNGGCYHLNLIYKKTDPIGKENVFNILKSFSFTQI